MGGFLHQLVIARDNGSLVSVPSRGMGGFLHIIIDTHNTNDAILVSVPSRGMGGFLPTKPVPCLKNICCFRPLSRYGWFPTLFGWGIYAIVKGCVSVPSRGMGGFLHAPHYFKD